MRVSAIAEAGPVSVDPSTAGPAMGGADPDGDLVARAAGGDRGAFETLLKRHYDRIHRVAGRLTGSTADAEDVAQEVCCALVEKIGGFRGEARFTTWLYGIVVNACHDHRRRGLTLKRLRDGLAVLVDLAPAQDGRDLHRRRWLTRELGRLERPLLETIVLVAGEGMTHAEAGLALGVAEFTVAWRMHEARKALGPRLKEMNDDV